MFFLVLFKHSSTSVSFPNQVGGLNCGGAVGCGLKATAWREPTLFLAWGSRVHTSVQEPGRKHSCPAQRSTFFPGELGFFRVPACSVRTCSSVPARRGRRKRKAAVCRAGILSSDRALSHAGCAVWRIGTCCNSPPPGDTLGTAREVRPAPARAGAPPSARLPGRHLRSGAAAAAAALVEGESGVRGTEAACGMGCYPGFFLLYGLGERESESLKSEVSDLGGAV